MKITPDLSGKKYHSWTVIERIPHAGKKAIWLLRCVCGRERTLDSNYIRKGWTQKDCGCSRDLSGRRFGRLVAISKVGNLSNTHSKYHCKCDCGKESKVRGLYLVEGTCRSCGCARTKSVEETGPITLRNHYRQNARKRNLEFLLTKEECSKLFSSPCGYCKSAPKNSIAMHKAISCAPRRFIYNGIDRVDNSKGYTIENSVSCCGNCNLMKREMSISEWMAHMKLILDNFSQKCSMKSNNKLQEEL